MREKISRWFLMRTLQHRLNYYLFCFRNHTSAQARLAVCKEVILLILKANLFPSRSSVGFDGISPRGDLVELIFFLDALGQGRMKDSIPSYSSATIGRVTQRDDWGWRALDIQNRRFDKTMKGLIHAIDSSIISLNNSELEQTYINRKLIPVMVELEFLLLWLSDHW